jgi:UDP-N-acetylglucosamine 2-epimerase (hydrolysing)
VTTEFELAEQNIREVVTALRHIGDNLIVIKPNNDKGSEIIEPYILHLADDLNVRLFPSLRFEFYLTFLRAAKYIIGNSSSGVREAPVFGVPSVNIGTRQLGRYDGPGIVNVPENADAIIEAVARLPHRVKPVHGFGSGNSAHRFVELLADEALWATQKQKLFCDALTAVPA